MRTKDKENYNDIPKVAQWVIINRKKNSIWKQVYDSYESAKMEYDFEVLGLRNGKKTGYVLEKVPWSDGDEPDREATARVMSLEQEAEAWKSARGELEAMGILKPQRPPVIQTPNVKRGDKLSSPLPKVESDEITADMIPW